MNDVERHPSGRIFETETVWTVGQILTTAKHVSIPAGGDVPTAAYFDVAVEPEPCTGVFPPPIQSTEDLQRQQASDQQAVKDFLARVDKSATFRQLVRLAVHAKRLTLTGKDRWTVTLVSPIGSRGATAIYATPFLPDRDRHVVPVPLRDSRPIGGQYYLCKGGALEPLSMSCCAIRALVGALTGAKPVSHVPWIGADCSIDPQHIVTRGAGERGALDYLVQRIIRELNPGVYPWISPLPFGEDCLGTPPDPSSARPLNDALRGAFDAIGGIKAVERYVAWQDEVLEAAYSIEQDGS